MGTHGAKGMQKVMGSNALTIVTQSKVPFIIVQEGASTPLGYKKILVPTSFHFENKQKIVTVAIIAKYFNSKICFIYSDIDPVTKTKSLQNLTGMKRYLDKKGVEYEIATSSSNNFNKDTLTTAKNIGTELIAIMNMQKDDVLGTGLFGKHYEQELIINDQQIPVLILNPLQTRLLGGTIIPL